MNKVIALLILVLLSRQLKAQSGIVDKATKGVLVYKPAKSNLITIYKQNGTLLRQLTVDDHLLQDAVVSPFALQGEYDLLVFDCLGTTSDNYIVVANDKSRLIGYIRRSDRHFKFETWPQHLVSSVSAVDFDIKLNPLHRQPSAGSSVIKVSGIDSFYPKQVKGNWLKVAWDEPKQGEGWIKWKGTHHELLIGISYVM